MSTSGHTAPPAPLPPTPSGSPGRGAPRHAEPCQCPAACSALGAGGHEIIAGLAPCLM